MILGINASGRLEKIIGEAIKTILKASLPPRFSEQKENKCSAIMIGNKLKNELEKL